jgi:hypothetical protein
MRKASPERLNPTRVKLMLLLIYWSPWAVPLSLARQPFFFWGRCG